MRRKGEEVDFLTRLMEQRVVATAMQSSHHQRCFDNSIVVVAVFFLSRKHFIQFKKKQSY